MQDRGYFACCLRVARLVAGLTQSELGYLAKPKVAQHNVAQSESGMVALREDTMQRYATALGMTLPELVSPERLASGLAELVDDNLEDVPTANGVRHRLRQELATVQLVGHRWLALLRQRKR